MTFGVVIQLKLIILVFDESLMLKSLYLALNVLHIITQLSIKFSWIDLTHK